MSFHIGGVRKSRSDSANLMGIKNSIFLYLGPTILKLFCYFTFETIALTVLQALYMSINSIFQLHINFL